MRARQELSCDFETCAKDKTNTSAKVWASCGVDINTLDVVHLGNSIDAFMGFISYKSLLVYFHNLAFDGRFILPWLISHGFEQLTKAEEDDFRYKKHSFSLVVDEMGNFYSMKIYWGYKIEKHNKKGKRSSKKRQWLVTEIVDSLKIIPQSVDSIGKNFLGLPKDEQKGKIDYKAIKPNGYKMTKEEEDYIIKDCTIIAKAIITMKERGFTKKTVSSIAFNEFIKITFNGDKKAYRRLLPLLDVETDDFIRKAYKGGWTYTNKKYKNKRDEKLYGACFDVNSLYPWVMSNNIFPCGHPIEYEGKYEYDEKYPLWIQEIHVEAFSIKENHFPCLQLKGNSRFVETEYLNEGTDVTLHLTNIDWELYNECYNFIGVTYGKGLKFKTVDKLFTPYIDKFSQEKIHAPNKAVRSQAKLMLNSLSGKFASKTHRLPMLCYNDQHNHIRFEPLKDEEYLVDSYYTAIGCFITAYARRYTITNANKNYDTFMYSDTDSIHLHVKEEDITKLDLPMDLEESGKLGLWKKELYFEDALYLGAKKYMEKDVITKVWDVKCAGLPQEVRSTIQTKDDFYYGKTFFGKKAKKVVVDGVLILETEYTIKYSDNEYLSMEDYKNEH